MLWRGRIRTVTSSGTFLCLASATAFGAMAVLGKLAYDDGATVGTLLAIRFLLAAALFWALVLGSGAARELRALDGRDVAVGLVLGACCYAIQTGCYFAALERIDASLLSLLLYTFPAMVAVAAVALGRERVDRRRVGAPAMASPRACRPSCSRRSSARARRGRSWPARRCSASCARAS